jgi:hypothetical protein
MRNITVNAPPELHYSEETAHIFEVLGDFLDRIMERGKEQTAQYLADAGIFAETVSLKFRKGKCYRRFVMPSGKKGTVSYNLKTQEIALNGKPVKPKTKEVS